MNRYRVYTENVNYEDTLALAREILPDSFTVFHGQGIYKGTVEKSLVFEILDGEHEENIRRFAWQVKKQNKQECVLVTAEPVDAFMV